jgi:hypothetical protein
MTVLEVLYVTVLVQWLSLSALSCFAVGLYARRLHFKPHVEEKPAIALIIPVRGASPGLHDLWRALCAQTYPHFRVLFALESADDPAHGALTAMIKDAKQPRTEIVIAGPAQNQGQKVQNQLAALDRLGRGDQIVVFADADIVPTKMWLAEIVDLLSCRAAMIVSGYRWMVPADRRLATSFACALNDALATMPRLAIISYAWGGSMAGWHKELKRIDIASWLKGSVNDDLQITRAAHAHGGVVETPMHMLLPSPVTLGWGELIGFVRRQYIQLRTYAPGHWALSAFAYALPLIGWSFAVPLAWSGRWYAILAIVIAIVLHQARTTFRLKVPRKLWGQETDGTVAILLRWGAPLATLLHAALIWSTLVTRTLRWGGRTYRIDAPQRIRIIAQD